METCLRGFSFMPENKVVDLKYVESDDLERTWKAARRERLKNQEQKIWEEFVKEQDIVSSLCKDDPYQFVDQLPEECIKELLDIELQKMRQEKMEETDHKEQPINQVEETPDNQHVVTFVEELEEDMLNIFEEDREDDVSGPEDEMLNESLSPPLTVREREAVTPDKTSTEGKSSNENVTDVIEGSIYCAKIKELRLKMVEELNNIMSALSDISVLNVDPSLVPPAMRRAKEFGARFGRVHLYQLQRQISDIERNNSNAPPLGARTHHQAQLCRVTSLHNNLLHALQVYRRSLPQTLCLCESACALRGLLGARAPRPAAPPAARALYDDAVDETSRKLIEVLDEYSAKMTDYLNSTENTSVSVSRKSKMSSKKSVGTWSRSGKSLLSSTEARLSMYSLDTRLTFNKSISSKDHSSGTSKRHASILVRGKQSVEKEEAQSKGPKKSPSVRRPLMRAPCSVPRPRAPHDQDVHTLVETVGSASSNISREVSPHLSPKSKNTTPRRNSRETTPRKFKDNRKSLNNTPRGKIQQKSPKHITPRGPGETKNETPRKIVTESSRTSRSPALDVGNSKNCEVQMTGRNKSPEFNVKMENTNKDDARGGEKMKKEKEFIRSRDHELAPANLEVTRLLRQLCGGDAGGSGNERVSGAKNVQLLCVSGSSPRQPSTPQLLRILEETIQKKAPKPLFPKPLSARDKDRYRMVFNIPENIADSMFQYRTKFVQHMLTSPMYANSTVGKPWEKIGRVSEKIIDELLLSCAKEMELHNFVKDLYRSETS